MNDRMIPLELLKFIWNNVSIFRLGFFVAFVAQGVSAYRLYHTQGSAFQRHLLHILYSGLFWTGIMAFVYHPYFTNVWFALLAAPLLVVHVKFAWFLLRKYGIGGEG
jgi:hypothetical protein